MIVTIELVNQVSFQIIDVEVKYYTKEKVLIKNGSQLHQTPMMKLCLN